MLLKRRMISALIISTSLSVLPALAHAQLTITNNTSKSSTTIINGMCSNALGAVGVTKPGQTNVVKDGAILFVCGSTPTNCVAHVYMTDDCTGDEVATVSFNISTGINNAASGVTAIGANQGYGMNADGFYIEFHGGPGYRFK